MLLMKESVLSLKEKNNRTLIFLLPNCPQVLKIFYDSPVKYYFWRFGYMIPRLYDWVQLSVYSTKVLFYKNCVAMKLTDGYVKCWC